MVAVLLAGGAARAQAAADPGARAAQDRPGGAIRRGPRPAEAMDGDEPGLPPGMRQFGLQGRIEMQRRSLVEQLPWSPERLAGVVPDPRVRAWAADLGSPDPARREAATSALRDQSLPDEQVWLQLAQPPEPLGAEAHARLVDVCRSRIVDAPRGALGIQMAGRLGDGNGVTVTGLIPNMPARKALRTGDRIVALDGRVVLTSNDLSEIVQMKRPGQRIKVTVMRGERDELGRVRGGEDGKPVETRIELEMDVGSRADLERFGDQGMDLVRPADAREQLALALVTSFPGPVRTVDPAWLEGEPREVDEHPVIVSLRQSLGGDGGAPQAALWKAQLDYLRGLARSPSLTPGERAYFEAVAARMEQLLAEALGDAAPVGGP